MASTHHKEAIRTILEHDVVWAAYALADLDPEHDEFTQWYMEDDAVLLRYEGLDPPILFATGPGDTILRLCRNLDPQAYQISFPEDILRSLEGTITIDTQIPMLRMNRVDHALTSKSDFDLRRLTDRDSIAIEQLYRGHRDAPDGFHPRQLDPGPFFGIWNSGELVATAGVHVVSKTFSVAAVGNIFTQPAFRKRGYAQACTQSVLLELENLGITTIVLNVAFENHAAIELYQRLGFSIHCSFYEGLITISYLTHGFNIR